jgi:hypothetical protein
MKLWTAQSVSLLGSCVSGFAVPSLAVTVLGATANQMALMSIVGALAFPLLGMVAATLVERWPKHIVMVSMDLGRMGAIGAIPALGILHRLDMTAVIVISCVLAVMGVFHDIAYQSHLPAVVPNDRIGEGNTKLELSNTASQSIGPALGGLLMHLVSAPLAMLVDAVSYLVSAISLGTIDRSKVQPVQRPERMPFFEELRQGLRFIVDTPRLGRIALCTATMNFGSAISGVVSLIFLYRVLHLQPLTVGLLFALSNLGVVGALYSIKFSERFGLLSTLSGAVLLNALGRLLLPAAALFFPLGCALVSLMLTSLAGPIYNVAQISYRQRVTPLSIQARMHAAMRTLNSATAPLGAMAGGILAETVGVQHALIFAAFVTALAALWFLPIAQREIPALSPEREAVAA